MLFGDLFENNIMWLIAKKIIAMGEFPSVSIMHDEDGITEGRQDPENSQVRFHTGPRFHRTKRSGARASRHPPRWRAQSDTPLKRDEGGGLISGSRSTRRFVSEGCVSFGGGIKDQRDSGPDIQR